MKEGKPTNDYQFLESYGLARTSSDDNSSTWSGSNGNNNNNKSTNETTIPLFQRNAATSRHNNQQQQQIGNVINNNDKINFQRGGGGAVERNNNNSNDWFSYKEWNNNNRSTTTSGTPIGPAPPPTNNINNTNNPNNKQPLKKILKNKNDFMIPIVRSNINSTTNVNNNNTIRSKPKQHQHQSASNLKGDIQQSMSQTNLRHQQHRAMNENNTNKTKSRSTSRTRAYYILLFIALYGLVGFVAYLGQGVLEMVRRVQLYRQKQGWSTITSNTYSKEESSVPSMLSNDITSTLQPIQHHPINIPPANQDNKPSSQSQQQQESVTQDLDPIDELNQQKESFNKSPSNTVSNEMTDIIDVYTDKTLLFSENELISTFRDISDALDYHSYSAKEVSKNTNDTTASASASAVRSNEKDFPFFWLIPPYTAGGHRVTRVINECFDLTRADITGSNKHKITYNSQTRNSLNKEQILVGSNLFDLHKLFNSVDPTHQKGRMFSFFFHPIQRSAYLFETFKNKMSSDEDKASDNNIHSMDLISFSNYILNNSTAITNENEKDKKDYIFRVSNWMTRLLSQTPIGPLNKYHVDAATLVLSKKCYVGLFHKMEESIQRLLSIFHWDESSPGGRLGTQNCLEEFYGTSFVRDLVVEGSDDWLALEKLNTWDIMLYENILKIFDEQRLLLYAN